MLFLNFHVILNIFSQGFWAFYDISYLFRTKFQNGVRSFSVVLLCGEHVGCITVFFVGHGTVFTFEPYQFLGTIISKY